MIADAQADMERIQFFHIFFIYLEVKNLEILAHFLWQQSLYCSNDTMLQGPATDQLGIGLAVMGSNFGDLREIIIEILFSAGVLVPDKGIRLQLTGTPGRINPNEVIGPDMVCIRLED